MAITVPDGRYIGRAKSWGFGVASTGTEQIGASLEIEEGEYTGKRLPWYGFLNSEENAKRTMKAMRVCGWDGVGPVTKAQGLDKNKVEIVVENDEYNGEVRSRVAWVNAIGVALKPMNEAQEEALNARLARWQTPSSDAQRPRRPAATGPRQATTRPASTGKDAEREAVSGAIGDDGDIPF